MEYSQDSYSYGQNPFEGSMSNSNMSLSDRVSNNVQDDYSSSLSGKSRMIPPNNIAEEKSVWEDMPPLETVIKTTHAERMRDIKDDIERYKLNRTTLNDYMRRELNIKNTYSRMTEDEAKQLLNYIKTHAIVPDDKQIKQNEEAYKERVDDQYTDELANFQKDFANYRNNYALKQFQPVFR